MNPPILLVDDRHKLRLNGTAVVRVQAPLSVKTCAPIDLVTLLNVGNSMNWTAASPAETPSRLDLVIKEHTTGISEISGGNRMAMEQKVDDLMAKGDTAFKPSLEHAVKLLDDRADKKRLGLIIFISDGLDNSTFKWSDESAAPVDPIRNLLKKYPVHTFGLGKTHDSKALHFIAKESYGTYSSITDNIESKMLEAFAVCLGGLKSIVAIDTSVEITSSSLSITRIDSGSYTPQGASGNILIGTLYAGEVKDFVVHFYYTTPGWTPGYYTILSGITANVTYKDVPRRQSTSTDRCSVSLPIHTAESGTTPANPCPLFPVVLQQMVRFKVLDFLISALKEFLVLKEETIGAIHGEEGDDLVLQVMAANLLQRKWKEFKQYDECWKEAPRSFLDLGGMDKDVTAMVNSLKRGLGSGCIYSWMSSYQMQRATVTGLPSHSVETRFRTPAMEAMVLEAGKQLAMEAHVQGQDKEVCKRAVEILEMINRRFELWGKLDCDVPQGFQTSPEHEDDSEFRDLTAVLHGDISRAKQHDIYLATDHAIKLWRSSFTPEEKSHGRSPDK
ncbi:hypothetical protein QOZ80_5AG0391670 [Eleusine coracana subsp. coracana]|nr:hypothetical protein QOZ80_5AG0391670 [Eleusine coracana subsp. coracana]